MTLTDVSLVLFADPVRTGRPIALPITARRTVAAKGKVVPLRAGLVFVPVLILTTLSSFPGITL